MPLYRAAKDTVVSTVVAGEVTEVKFGTKAVDVTDEGLAKILDALADNPDHPVKHARADSDKKG